MDQNIVFQALDQTQKDPSWSNSKIVYVLKCVPDNYDVTDVVNAISTALGYCIIRYSRIALGSAINLKQVNRTNGAYWQAN